MKTKLKRNLFFGLLLLAFACKNKTPQTPETINNKGDEVYALDNGLDDGMQTANYENGNKKYDGKMQNGKREGEWFLYFENGNMWSRCNYVENKKQGKSIVYLPSGKKAYEGMYENDKPIGEWIYYNEDGTVNKKVQK